MWLMSGSLSAFVVTADIAAEPRVSVANPTFIGAGALLGALLTHGTATWTALVPGPIIGGGLVRGHRP